VWLSNDESGETKIKNKKIFFFYGFGGFDDDEERVLFNM